MKKTVKLDYPLAQRLAAMIQAFQTAQALLQTACQFAGIPLDRQVDLGIDKYDGSGTVDVTWDEPDPVEKDA